MSRTGVEPAGFIRGSVMGVVAVVAEQAALGHRVVRGQDRRAQGGFPERGLRIVQGSIGMARVAQLLLRGFHEPEGVPHARPVRWDMTFVAFIRRDGVGAVRRFRPGRGSKNQDTDCREHSERCCHPHATRPSTLGRPDRLPRFCGKGADRYNLSPGQRGGRFPAHSPPAVSAAVNDITSSSRPPCASKHPRALQLTTPSPNHARPTHGNG